MTLDIALAASVRDWPDRLHRHLLDHGGGRVVARVMGPDQALTTSFDVLLIDDICSFLSPRLVARIKQRSSEVVGVYSPVDGSDAKRRLLDCGIGDVIETEASPEEFIVKLTSALAHRVPTSEPVPERRSAWSIGFAGVCDGVGCTEVATGLAMAIDGRASVALVDADQTWPSIAQRLDLALHPNIRTALDAVVHGKGDLSRATHQFEGVTIIGGVADGGTSAPMNPAELNMLFDSLTTSHDLLVVDLGTVDRVNRRIFREFDAVALVGSGDPVGIARLLVVADRFADALEDDQLLLVVNRAPRRKYHLSEIRREVAMSCPRGPIVVLPADRHLAESIWEGRAHDRGPFAKAIGNVADLILERAIS